MNQATKIALQISLNELINKRAQLNEMADQYTQRAQTIKHDEIPEIENKIREIQADLDV